MAWKQDEVVEVLVAVKGKSKLRQEENKRVLRRVRSRRVLVRVAQVEQVFTRAGLNTMAAAPGKRTA